MWVFLNNAFFSVVADRDKPDHLMVRARLRGDLELAFPGVKVKTTPDADYRYRASVPRARVAAALAARVHEIDYDNFKDSVAPGDHARHDAYLRVWGAMHAAQVAAAPRRRKRRPRDDEQVGFDAPRDETPWYYPYGG